MKESSIMSTIKVRGLSLLTMMSVTGILLAPQKSAAADTNILTAEQIAFMLTETKGLRVVVRRVDLPTVTFEYNSNRLTSQARTQLDELAKALSYDAFKGIPIEISGHTDAKGSAAYNQQLSERRAQAVKGYLTQNHGLPPAKVRTVGFGENLLDPQYPPFAPEQRRVGIALEAGS
jgi:outer membrane protein OmpA-like peptidoglycan-associated protein